MKNTPVARRFSENLRRTRHEVGLSQEMLAPRAGLHRTEISLLERGQRIPRIDTVAKIAKALGVETSVLLKGI